MTEVSAGRRRAAAERVLAVADANLYRRNPFRITGLAAAATGREVRQCRQRALVMAGHGLPARRTGPLPPTTPPTTQDLRAAFDELGNPERRLVDELFWLWGPPRDCGCPVEVHLDHDDAVLAHATVLDGTEASVQKRLDLWRGAADDWSEVLARDEFWDHLRHRVRELGDRRLDSSTVDGVRDALPRALLATMSVAVAAERAPERLVPAFEAWQFEANLVDDARFAASADLVDRIDTLVTDLHRMLDAGKVVPAGKRAVHELVPAANRLEALLPYERYRRSRTLRERTALILNNTAVAMSNRRDAQDRLAAIDDLFRRAARFAVTDDNRRVIENNHAPIRAILQFKSSSPGRTPIPVPDWEPSDWDDDEDDEFPMPVWRPRLRPGTVVAKVTALPVCLATVIWLACGFSADHLSAPAIFAMLVGGLMVTVAVVRSHLRRALRLLVSALVVGLVSVVLTAGGVGGSTGSYLNVALGMVLFCIVVGAMGQDRSSR